MSTPRASRRNAFTLIEILVVLAIAAIVSAITVGGFHEMSAGNKRVSCQSNLAQIYQACRMYAADEGGKFPYYNFSTPNNCNSTSHGIGLWSLYTFPDPGDSSSSIPPDPDHPAPLDRRMPSPNGPFIPIERYIRSSKILHCPEDVALGHTNLVTTGTSFYNPEYLSYQSCDGSIPTYSSVRTTTKTDTGWQNQLMNYDGTSLISRPPSDKTIVTWCIYHRGSRDYDNVLFYDGSVQLMPQTYNGQTDWHRDPKPPQ